METITIPKLWDIYAKEIHPEVACLLWEAEDKLEGRYCEHERLAWEILWKAGRFFCNPNHPYRPQIPSEYTFEERRLYSRCFIRVAVRIYGTAYKVWLASGRPRDNRFQHSSLFFWSFAISLHYRLPKEELEKAFPGISESNPKNFYIFSGYDV